MAAHDAPSRAWDILSDIAKRLDEAEFNQDQDSIDHELGRLDSLIETYPKTRHTKWAGPVGWVTAGVISLFTAGIMTPVLCGIGAWQIVKAAHKADRSPLATAKKLRARYRRGLFDTKVFRDL